MVTRVTNSMLSRTLLSNLNYNLGNLDSLNNQLATGRKYAHISDDPAALIYSQSARNKIARLDHFRESVSIAQNWLTQAESGIMELQGVVGCIYEELINSGGAKTIQDRQNLGMVVSQYRDHYLDTLNAAYGDRFVFSAYNTPGDYVNPYDPTVKPFTLDGDILRFNGFDVSQFDGMPAEFMLVNCPPGMTLPVYVAELDAEFGKRTPPTTAAAALADFNNSFTPPGTLAIEDIYKFHQMKNDLIVFNVGPGIEMPVTINGLDVLFFATQDTDGNQIVRNTYSLLTEVYGKIVEETTDPVTGEKIPVWGVDHLSDVLIKPVKEAQNHLLVKTAEIGGRCTRLELLEARYDSDFINYEDMRSNAEDADIAEVIMYMKMAETVYQAALSAGARIIQPTLMDFLR